MNAASFVVYEILGFWLVISLASVFLYLLTLSQYIIVRKIAYKEVSLSLRVRIDGVSSLYGKVLHGLALLLLLMSMSVPLLFLTYIPVPTMITGLFLQWVLPITFIAVTILLITRTLWYGRASHRTQLYVDANHPVQDGVTRRMILARELATHGVVFFFAPFFFGLMLIWVLTSIWTLH